MAQTSNLDLDEEEVELSLGLSLGRSFRKPPATATSSSTVDLKGLDGRDEPDPNSLDPQKKRELHALRRQEARKKREQKKNGHWNGNGVSVNRSDLVADKMLLETQRFEARVRDRTVKENEGSRSERRPVGDQNVGLTLTPNPNPNPNFRGYHPNGFTVLPPPPPPPTAAMQYPFHPMPYVPFGNGFHYPYMVPYWSPATAAVPPQPSDSAARADGPRPDGCRAFRPFQQSDLDASGAERVAGSDSGQNGSKGGGPSSGSTGSSSSAVSDNQSEFLRGGSSSDTRSHSSRLRPPVEQSQPRVLLARNPQRQSEQCASTHLMELAQNAEEAIDKPVLNTIATQSGWSKPEELATPISNTLRSVTAEPISTTKSPPKSPLLPIPMAGHDCDDDKKPGPPLPSLPHMPCVSTTGNGPNGKTITGFLYRYTKTEVSIVCVCHGSSFSPAEFVKHAGGTDISQPLKHIVVVPSAFG
ncbi:ninja-family protein 2-like [Magnolia sinica]|uniref:ninja-family protein 2-like n=1 Tax=Magnolia sinica TaxID=86752 RepID=UPI00265AF872|nr:ninja-family protein 2-like [Magnolia sinica]